MINENDVTLQDAGNSAKIDFELFSVALKNLIDNALKYGESKPIITITQNNIIIQNQGKELSINERNFENMFNRKYESSQNGLGLGLYISYAIIKAHEYKLRK
jgi:two-component system OmpR family sensor kinase